MVHFRKLLVGVKTQSIWSKVNEGKTYEDEDSIRSSKPLFLTFVVDGFHLSAVSRDLKQSVRICSISVTVCVPFFGYISTRS